MYGCPCAVRIFCVAVIQREFQHASAARSGNSLYNHPAAGVYIPVENMTRLIEQGPDYASGLDV